MQCRSSVCVEGSSGAGWCGVRWRGCLVERGERRKMDRIGVAMDCYGTGIVHVNRTGAAIAQGRLPRWRRWCLLERSGDAAGSGERGPKAPRAQSATTGWIGFWKRMPRCDMNMVWAEVGVWSVAVGQCWRGGRAAARTRIYSSRLLVAGNATADFLGCHSGHVIRFSWSLEL
jgi:hypothetical protein